MLNFTLIAFILLQLGTLIFSFNAAPKTMWAPLFTLIIAGQFLCYFIFLKFLKRDVWKLILISAVINLFAFPAFLSNDIYSYLAFGKIFVTYRQNPYIVPHSFFVDDPLLKLNHWPDSVSRYGPNFLIPIFFIYWITSGNILLSAYLLKIFLIIVGYLSSCYLIEKINKKVLLFFALNPFVIIEMIASPHSDSLMISLALLSLYFLLNKKRPFSVLAILLSAITKIVSLPMTLVAFVPQKFSKYYVLLFWLTSWIGTGAIIYKWSINPWYLLLPFTFGVFFSHIKTIRYLLISLSIAALVRYLPFFYLSFFDPSNKIRLVLFILALVPYFLWFIVTFPKRIKELRKLLPP